MPFEIPREKIDPGVRHPPQWAVLEGSTSKGGGSRRAKTPAFTTNDGLFGRPRDLFDRRPGRTNEVRLAWAELEGDLACIN
jgi:hypothetical protein